MKLIRNQELYTSVFERLKAVTNSLIIVTANLKDVHLPWHEEQTYISILDVFRDLNSKNIKIYILLSGLPSEPFLKSLQENSDLLPAIHFRFCPRNHQKMIFIDNDYVYVGSANFTGAALGAKDESKRNFEIGFESRETMVANSLFHEVYHLWRGFACTECQRQDECTALHDKWQGWCEMIKQ